MYKVVTTFRKINDSDVWITPRTLNYFSELEQANEISDFLSITYSSSGISNVVIKITTTNEYTITCEADSLENLSNYDYSITTHPFTILRNRKLREYNIPQYLVFRKITEM